MKTRTSDSTNAGTPGKPANLTRPSLVRRLCSVSIVAVLSASCLSITAAPSVSATVNNGCQERWIGSWMAAKPVNSLVPGPGSAAPSAFMDQTMRMVVAPHHGGDTVRITLSNRFGTGPVTFNSLHIGVQASQAGIVPGTNRPLTFAGKSSVTIPAGSTATSDELSFGVEAFQHLAISFHVAGGPVALDEHPEPAQESYVSPAGSGDLAAATSPTEFAAVPVLYAVEALDVLASGPVGTIVTLGDSITDGTGSTWGADNRYPDLLQKELQTKRGGEKFTVLNAGIGANAVSVSSPITGPSGAARFSHDVSSRPGVTDVILLEGINDIGIYGASAAQITAALANIADQAHAKGYTITAGTLLPAQDYTLLRESTRQEVNAWIRTTDVFDRVVDFDLGMRDPSNPNRLNPAYDSGDGLHPNDAGYAKMVSLIGTNTFRTTC